VLSLLFALFFASCGDGAKQDQTGEKSEEANAEGDQSIETGSEDAEQRMEPNLPEVDLEGYEFTFLTHLYDGDDWINPTPLELIAEQQTGEPVNDAVYLRNMKITEKYNFDIKMEPASDEKSAMNKAAKAGDDLYDAAIMFNNNIPGIVTSGLLSNIANLPYVDLSQPWWDPAVNSMSIDHKNYLLGGDLLILDNEATNALLFNKDLMADLGLGLPYDLVNAGKWTLDKMNDFVRGAASDLNGDGLMKADDDRWGYVAFNDTFHAMLVGGGGTLALKDESDIPYIDFASPRNLAVTELVMDIMYDKENTLNIQADVSPSDLWTASYVNSFDGGRALFMWVRMRVVERFRGMEANFGIIPMPKYDEAQKNYCSVVNPYTGVLLGVPISAGEPEKISIVLEALAAESRYTLQPAYYDVVLTRKYARDEESEEMLDVIFNSRVYDIGAVYSFGGVFIDFINLAAKSDRNVISYYEKKIGSMENAIAKLVDTFQSME